jgi:hypothetical protein
MTSAKSFGILVERYGGGVGKGSGHRVIGKAKPYHGSTRMTRIGTRDRNLSNLRQSGMTWDTKGGGGPAHKRTASPTRITQLRPTAYHIVGSQSGGTL